MNNQGKLTGSRTNDLKRTKKGEARVVAYDRVVVAKWVSMRWANAGGNSRKAKVYRDAELAIPTHQRKQVLLIFDWHLLNGGR